MGDERTMVVNGVELCVDTFGSADDPAVLLIGGASSPLDWWEAGFCASLAAGQRFVIRYDQRHTGRSTTGQDGFSIAELAADAVGVLDGLGVCRAHLVGVSLGAKTCVLIALDQPERVASLALLSASPGGPGLPPMSASALEFFETAPWPPDWPAVVDYLVSTERAFAAPQYFDEVQVRAAVERRVARTADIAAGMTSWAGMDTGGPIRERLSEIPVPALVIHGTADPLYPYGHAETLAAELPNARLLPLDGVGHQFPPSSMWPRVVAELLEHTSG